MALTGPKTDLWLVKMVGLISICIGLALITGKQKDAKSLSITTAIAFITIDIYYNYKDIIPPIYLIDALLQAIFIILVLRQKI